MGENHLSAEDVPSTGQPLLSGQFVLHTLIAEFTAQVDKKVDNLLSTRHKTSTWTKDGLMKYLQRGEDVQFDQLLSSLGCVAEYCLPSLLDTLFGWYEHQLPKNKITRIVPEDKQHKQGSKGRSDSQRLSEDAADKCREVAVEIVFCLVLIEVLKQIPVHPLPDAHIRQILARAFKSFRTSAQPKVTDNIELRIVADLYAEAMGVLAQTKFQAVRHKFMHELYKDKEATPTTLISLIAGMKYFRVKMYPIEDFEASFRFLQELATYSLDMKNREVKHALAGLFVEVLVPVAAAVKTEVNVPVLRDFVDSLYPTSLELSKRQKNKQAMFPLITCLLCVSQKTFFLNNWHIFLDICFSTLKARDQKLPRVALESLYRLLWVYMVRIKCESNNMTQTRLQSIAKNLFPPGARNVIPKDTPLNIFVKIIQFIALERLDFAMKEIILDLLSISVLTTRAAKPVTIYPERMNIGLRAFLVITDSLQQKDGAPPMPSTVNVMPSGSTIRAKKTFLNKTLTEEEARVIGVSLYSRHVQRALDGILLALYQQVGVRLMLTNSQVNGKDPQDFLSGELKPKIELFRTCVAAMPRLMPMGMSHSDLLDMLSRLTVHVDEELRSRAFASLQAFVADFPPLSEEVVASFLSFVVKQVSDIHQNLLDGSLKVLISLIGAWKSNITVADAAKTSSKQETKNAKIVPRCSTSPTSGRSVYAPIINRIEGFALVLLCNSRNVTRKLACNILKEVRLLAHALDYGKRDDALCLDILDSFCPEVSENVFGDEKYEKYFPHLTPQEKESILSKAYEKELSSLVDSTCNWPIKGGVHPWILFMNSFVETSRLPKFCPTAMSYSWPDSFIRLAQIQRHIEPTMTTGSKKVSMASLSNGDQNLVLWTNYLIFACKSSPSSASVKLKQSAQAAIPAGTPDWKVSLIRDSERLDAVPSTLFQRLVGILRSDYCQAYKEAAVLGLGHVSVASFYDLLTEGLHLIHEASEIKKQENVRRRRRRENIRIVLIKLFANLASHRVLSKGIYKQVEKIPGSQKIPKEIIQEFLEEMRSILESLDKFEMPPGTSFSSQPPNVLATSFGSQMVAVSSSGNIKDEMRFNFAEVVIQLIRHYPVESRSNLLASELRKRLFVLFSTWYDKYASDGDNDKPITHPNLRLMRCAECSVLCCGPVFDMGGYFYKWLEQLLSSNDPYIHQLGQETVILLLHFNPEYSDLLAWLSDKCYTGTDLVATSCFLGISTVFSSSEYKGDAISLLALALFKTTDANAQVTQAAEHLLSILLSRFYPSSDNGEAKPHESDNCRDLMAQRSRNNNCTSLLTVARTKLKATEELARLHPEITHALLSEVFLRFRTANLIGKQHLLEMIQPWLQNVELVLAESQSESLSDQHKVTCTQSHPWLPQSGWGSEKASLHLLNNLTYLTAYYHHTLEAELQNCWSVLCNTWHDNLTLCLQYLTALYSVHINEQLRQAVRLAVTFLGRAKSLRVTTSLIEECLISQPVFITIEPHKCAPFYKIIPRALLLNSSKDSPVKKSASSDRKQSPSASEFSMNIKDKEPPNAGALLHETTSQVQESLHRSSSPVIIERRTKNHTAPFHHRLSLQVSSSGDKNTRTEGFQLGAKARPLSSLAKRSPILSSSMMSLNNTTSESSTNSSAMSSPRFNTVSTGRSNELVTKQSGIDILTSKLPQKLTSYRETRSKSPLEKSDSAQKNLTKAVKMNSSSGISAYERREIQQHHMKDYHDWLSTHHNDSTPQPLPLCSKPFLLPLHELIPCDNIVGLLCCNVACIFLSELVYRRSVDINWHVHLPSVLLSLILNMDQIQIPEVPFYCRRLLAQIFHTLLPNKLPHDIVSSILCYAPNSSLHTLATIPVASSIHPNTLINPFGMTQHFKMSSSMHEFNEEQSDNMSEDRLKDSFLAILRELVSNTGSFWMHEDVTPKVTNLKSIDTLTVFVRTTYELLDHENPRLKLRERLGNEASKFTINTSNKHHACRSLQVFRALKLPLSPVFFNKLVRCLVNRIMYGSDTETQSQVIEILMTLLHDCEITGKDDLSREPSFSPNLNVNGRSLDKNSPVFYCGHTKSEQFKKPRSPTPGRLPNFPTSPIRAGTAPLSLPSSQASGGGGQSEAPKRGRKVHAHRRSGSVTLSKKMATEVLHFAGASTGPFHSASSSVSELPTETGFTATENNQNHGDAPNEKVIVKDSLTSPDRNMTSSNSPNCGSSRDHTPTSSEPDDVFSPVHRMSNCSRDRKSTFAQIFWIAVALLESDYEHEFLMAVQLIEKVLAHLPLYLMESRLQIERYLTQIKWVTFSGIQSLLLKGLTSSVTYNATFRLLSSFTTISNLKIISGDHEEGHGFAMNVVFLLPHLLDCFSEPDQMCADAAKNIAQVCIEDYSQKKKLQSLAHVMTSYCNKSYGKPCTTWISVVAKYLHETFPEGIREQLNFLTDMLDKGPISTHLSCLRIVYSLLSLSEILLSNAPVQVSFTQNILRSVSRFVNSTKLWKEALNVLKLAVSRSSAIAKPSTSGPLVATSPLTGEIDRIELPGRTLTFQYNLADTPIVGRRRGEDHSAKRQTYSGSPSYHPSSASSIVASWKRPHLSQKRTHESILCVLPVCGKHIQLTNEQTSAAVVQEHIRSRSPEIFVPPTPHEELPEEEVKDSEEEKAEENADKTGDDEAGSVIDDIRVLRNFDFLDEFEENEDGFTTGFQNQASVPASQDSEVNNTEEDPETCNLTPISNREAGQDNDLPHPEEEYVSDHSQDDAEELEEQANTSLTSGILSQSWSGSKSIFTEMETSEFHSSLMTVSSSKSESEKPRSKTEEELRHVPPSSEESISIVVSSQPLKKQTLRMAKSETSLDKKRASSSESLRTSELERTNERDENTSDSISNIEESGNECSSPMSSMEELYEDPEKSHDNLTTTILQLTTPPPPSLSSSPQLQSFQQLESTIGQVDIPIVEPPPTSDITANLTAMRFDPPSHYSSAIDSPSRGLPVVHSVPTSFSSQKSMVCQNTTYTTWKLHMASMATYNDAAFICKTFDLFPTLFRVLCVDFSTFSKEGCKHLGGQLSKIAEHFSSMVKHLPSQIKCPTCLTTKSAIEPVVEEMKLSVLELQHHLDAYNAKQKSALDCIDLIKSYDTEDRLGGVTLFGSGSSQQLELCRILYKLHFQLLLLLKSFNKVVQFVARTENKNISEQLATLKKKILVVEKTFQAHRDKPDMEMMHDLKSMTVEEAEQVLTSSTASEHVHLAIRQLSLLRRLWGPDIFGGPDEPAADFLIKIYFRHLEGKSGEKFYAILDSEDSSHSMCEKLMEVNSQIQQSLDSLAAGEMNRTPPTTKKTHL